MVVFTSGIVDGRAFLSSLSGWGVWLLMALRWWGMGSSTLLGPEGSAGPRSRVGVVLVASGCLPLLVAVLCGWSWVLVGLLFEICIVDASIFVAGC
jgi:hypothetical protein